MQPSSVTQEPNYQPKIIFIFISQFMQIIQVKLKKQNSRPVYHNKKRIYNYKTFSFENEKPLRLTAKKYSNRLMITPQNKVSS